MAVLTKAVAADTSLHFHRRQYKGHERTAAVRGFAQESLFPAQVRIYRLVVAAQQMIGAALRPENERRGLLPLLAACACALPARRSYPRDVATAAASVEATQGKKTKTDGKDRGFAAVE